jgi:hypothetical protein
VLISVAHRLLEMEMEVRLVGDDIFILSPMAASTLTMTMGGMHDSD